MSGYISSNGYIIRMMNEALATYCMQLKSLEQHTEAVGITLRLELLLGILMPNTIRPQTFGKQKSSHGGFFPPCFVRVQARCP